MKDHSHASDSALIQELATTRGALDDAIRIGETLQARIDHALEELREHDEDVVIQLIIARLEGKT